jgi:hypothetical protein
MDVRGRREGLRCLTDSELCGIEDNIILLNLGCPPPYRIEQVAIS